MILNDELKILDEKISNMNIPFDKGLPILQELLWDIADRYNTTGQEVLRMYFEMKSVELKDENK